MHGCHDVPPQPPREGGCDVPPQPSPGEVFRRPARWPGRAAILAARAYQRTLSPLIPVHCRFHPTCSHYFIEAVERHGFVRGVLLGLRRLARCQPLCRGGYDPVP